MTLALTSGVRRGELCALEWRHVDFEKNTIDISQALGLDENFKKKIKDTKNENSERLVAIPQSVMLLLKEYQKQWKEHKFSIGSRWKEKVIQYLFVTNCGTPLFPTIITNEWRKFLAAHNIRHIRFHDLRHTSATLLINQGVHAKVISERLGHSDIGTTMNTYGHLLRKADHAAADKFELLFPNKSAK